MANTIGFDPVAWSIDGGSHPGALLRKLAYAATQGAEGIITPLDCKVRQLSGAGPQVRIDTGAISLLNRFTGGAGQTYIASASSESRMDIDPTAGTVRSDLVVVRIEDPQYAAVSGLTVGNAPTFQYTHPLIIKNVPASTMSAAELNLGYPAVALARIDIPTNTTNITDAMIKDLRKIARPRSELQPFTVLPTQALGSGQKLLGTATVAWPTINKQIAIPSWASEVTIEVIMGGVRANPNGAWGWLSARLGAANSAYAVVTQECGFDVNVPAANNYDRIMTIIADTRPIPVEIRGTTQPFVTLGRNGNTVATGNLEVDSGSAISGKLHFKEVAS